MSNKGGASKEIRLERVYPENLQSHFVSSMVVQQQPDIFTVSFFEVWPPLILGESDEEVKEQLDKLDRLEAKCVGRFAVTPAKMKEFFSVMSESIKKYEETAIAKTEK